MGKHDTGGRPEDSGKAGSDLAVALSDQAWLGQTRLSAAYGVQAEIGKDPAVVARHSTCSKALSNHGRSLSGSRAKSKHPLGNFSYAVLEILQLGTNALSK